MSGLGQHQQQLRRRRVRFAPIVHAASSGPLDKEEVKELWYDQSDLASFRSEARKFAATIIQPTTIGPL